MDELEPEQYEEVVRQLSKIYESLKSSGVLDTGRLASQIYVSSGIAAQMQAVTDSIILSQIPWDAINETARVLANYTFPRIEYDTFFAELTRAAGIVKAVEDSLIGVSFEVQASYTEMIAALSGVHQTFVGAGSGFAITLGKGEADDITQHECRFELSAGKLEATTSDTVVITDNATVELIPAGVDQVVKLETLSASLSVQPIRVVHTIRDWSIQRLEESDDVHSFTFRGYGESARTIVDWLCTTTRSAITGETPLGNPTDWSGVKAKALSSPGKEYLIDSGDEVVQPSDEEPQKYAAQGLISLWEAIDQACIDLAWNWGKQCRTLNYSKMYARPVDATEWHVRVSYNANGLKGPTYYLNSGNDNLGEQQEEASLFIRTIEEYLSIGLGHGEQKGYRESDFKCLLTEDAKSARATTINTPIDDNQVFQGRFSLLFTDVIHAIGHVLGQCVRRTGGQIQYQWTEKPPLTYYTLTANGIAGYEIILSAERPGFPGMDYYTRPSNTERQLWRDIGNALYEWTETELKNLVILELVARPGGDASGILKSPHESQAQFDQAVVALLAFYDEIAQVDQLIDEEAAIYKSSSADTQSQSSGSSYEPSTYQPGGPISIQQQLPQVKGGRPRDPHNEWAYEQVRVQGRQPNDVYPEWLERIGDKAKVLDNPRDSFNKAIKPKKRK